MTALPRLLSTIGPAVTFVNDSRYGSGLNARFCTTSTHSSFTPTSPYFAYGEADFVKIRRNKQFFVDNSRYIALCGTAADNVLFVRPPRMGKSLFLSMMATYYDRNTSDELFEECFGDLDIAEHARGPGSTLARQFDVLKLDFTIDVTRGASSFRKSLNGHVNDRCELLAQQNGLQVLFKRLFYFFGN